MYANRAVVAQARWWSRSAVFAVLAVVGALIVPNAASATTRTLSATPYRNLADGQAITVSGAGFGAFEPILLFECQRTYGCDGSDQFVFPDSTGAFSLTFFASRVINVGGRTVDCAKTLQCLLVATEANDRFTGAETPINFSATGPLAPTLAITMSLDGSDGVVTSTGQVVLHGNVSCTRPAMFYMDASVSQAQNGKITQSGGHTQFLCAHAGTMTWQLTVYPDDQLFTTGAAQVYVDAEARTNRQGQVSDASGTVILQAANLPVLIPSTAHVTVPAPGSSVVLHYWVLLSTPSMYPVTFSYSTLNGTAVAPTDYTTTSGSVTMPAGTTKAIVPITINGTTESPGNRTFILSVTGPSNAMLGADNGRGTITLTHN